VEVNNEHHAKVCSTMLARIDHADVTIADLTEAPSSTRPVVCLRPTSSQGI
jgi:hypothetical protein